VATVHGWLVDSAGGGGLSEPQAAYTAIENGSNNPTVLLAAGLRRPSVLTDLSMVPLL